MRILFSTTAGAGHVGPLVPFVRACERAGHDVLVAGPPLAERHVLRAGLPYRGFAAPAEQELDRVRARLHAAAPQDVMATAVREMFVNSWGRAALPGVMEIVDEWRPDLIVPETCEAAAALAAERAGIPLAWVGVCLSDQLEDLGHILAVPAIDALGRELGLAPDPGGERMRRTPLLTLAPASLQPLSRNWRTAQRLRFRAAAEPEAPALPDWWAGSDAPLVYLSFGTEAQSPTHGYYPSLYRGAVDALAALPVRVLLTIDSADPDELGPLPKSVHLERWVPQPAVMPHTAAMVGHGGSGSTLAALRAGVPMALLGLFADQPENAQLVEQAGAGLALEGGEAALPRLTDAVRELLGDPSYRANAGRISADIGGLAPVDEAAGALAEVAAHSAVAA